MENKLFTKKILIISSDFFDTTKTILDEMAIRGWPYSFFDIRPKMTSSEKLLFQKNPRYKNKIMARYTRQIIEESHPEDYSLLLMINPFTFSQEQVQTLCQAFNQAKKVLYLWDAVDNYPNQIDFVPYFDHAYSFQKSDAAKYHLEYRPTYFNPKCLSNEPNPSPNKYDVSFLGSSYPNRYTLLRSFSKAMEEKGIGTNFKLYFRSKGTFLFRKATCAAYRKAHSSEFFYKPLSSVEKDRLIRASKAVIDIPFATQTGLPERTIETLVMGRKLITTNKNIVDYDLYNSQNVAIITETDFSAVTKEFLDGPVFVYPPEVIEGYSIGSFVDFLIGANYE